MSAAEIIVLIIILDVGWILYLPRVFIQLNK